ncbi:MAG: hypothetical protein WBG93_08695 [Thermoanaerobaculia bacterium]
MIASSRASRLDTVGPEQFWSAEPAEISATELDHVEYFLGLFQNELLAASARHMPGLPAADERRRPWCLAPKGGIRGWVAAQVWKEALDRLFDRVSESDLSAPARQLLFTRVDTFRHVLLVCHQGGLANQH